MSKLFTLAQLWAEAGEKPFDAHAANEDVIRVVAISPRNEAVGWYMSGKTAVRSALTAIWTLYTPPPKLVPHWHAIRGAGERYAVLDYLFPSLAEAQRHFPDTVRLATEYPPVMLPAKESK